MHKTMRLDIKFQQVVNICHTVKNILKLKSLSNLISDQSVQDVGKQTLLIHTFNIFISIPKTLFQETVILNHVSTNIFKTTTE